jgi:hypothetical protein
LSQADFAQSHKPLNKRISTFMAVNEHSKPSMKMENLTLMLTALIFNSQARLILAYRRELMSSERMRTAPNGIYLNLEYNFLISLSKWRRVETKDKNLFSKSKF